MCCWYFKPKTADMMRMIGWSQTVGLPVYPDSTASDASEPSSDVTTLTLAPGEGAEIKLVMAKDNTVKYDWSASGGAVNFDTHADAPGISYHGYGKRSEERRVG